MTSELNEKNYRRIILINGSLLVPLVLIFAWPYSFACELAGIKKYFSYPGAVLFAVPFAITILHGHVTLALGSLHRHHYYNWLVDNPYTYGLFFNPIFIRTRFRLTILALSLAWIPVAFFLSGIRT